MEIQQDISDDQVKELNQILNQDKIQSNEKLPENIEEIPENAVELQEYVNKHTSDINLLKQNEGLANNHTLIQQLDTFKHILTKLYQVVSHTSIKDLERHLTFLRSTLAEGRKPRFAIIGRRGAGKSSLINALLGKQQLTTNAVLAQTGNARWVECSGIELLDTRGCQDTGLTVESDVASDALDSIKAEMAKTEKFPDVIVFVVKASDVESAIDADIKFVKDVSEIVNKIRGLDHPCLMIAVVNQIDQLAPSTTDWDLIFPKNSFGSSGTETLKDKQRNAKAIKKRENIDKAVDVILKRGHFKQVIPVCSYFDEYDDYRYNIDTLQDILQTGLPNEAQFNYCMALDSAVMVKKKFAIKIVDSFTALAAIIAMMPSLPVEDIFFLSTLQISMVVAISYFSTPVSDGVLPRSVQDFCTCCLGVTTTAIIGREVVRAFIKWIPGVGYYSSVAMASGGTLALGKAAIAYFIDRLDPDHVKLIYNNQLKNK